jgi:HTH-type transcriptional regulator / antitoxin HipB
MDFHVATVSQLSAHLRALRKARKLTQAELGALLGVKQSRIADVESAPGSISVTQLHQVLSALGAQLVLRDLGGGWQPAKRRVDDDAASTPTEASGAPKVRAARTARAAPASSEAKKPGGSW